MTAAAMNAAIAAMPAIMPMVPEGVGVEQQTAQGLALERRGDLGRQRGVLGLRDGLCRQLGVGLAAAGGLEVIGDEVVGVDLGLSAGGQLLAAVLPHRGELRGGDGLAVRGREELVV